MKPMVSYYVRCALLHWKTLHQYKFNFFVTLVKVPLTLVLYWFLWRTIYRHYGERLGTYSFHDMMLYVFTVQWIIVAVSANVAEKIATDIRSGALSLYLARPVSYLPTQFATFIAHWSFTMAITLIPFIMLFFWIKGAWFNPIHFLQLLLALLGGALVHFLLEACLGSCAFWLNRIFGLRYLLTTVFDIAGGKLIPLTLFPAWFRTLSHASPFRAIYFEPIGLLFDGSFIRVLWIQLLWILVLSTVIYVTWHRGRVVYEACG